MKPGHYLSDISGLCDLSDLSALSDIPGTRYLVCPTCGAFCQLTRNFRAGLRWLSPIRGGAGYSVRSSRLVGGTAVAVEEIIGTVASTPFFYLRSDLSYHGSWILLCFGIN